MPRQVTYSSAFHAKVFLCNLLAICAAACTGEGGQLPEAQLHCCTMHPTQLCWDKQQTSLSGQTSHHSSCPDTTGIACRCGPPAAVTAVAHCCTERATLYDLLSRAPPPRGCAMGALKASTKTLQYFLLTRTCQRHCKRRCNVGVGYKMPLDDKHPNTLSNDQWPMHVNPPIHSFFHFVCWQP